MLLPILSAACLLFIFYQDLRYRAVYWIMFPVLLLLLQFDHSSLRDLQAFFFNSACNIGFLLLQFLLLSLYFSWKESRLVNLLRGYLGWGDVLMLLCLACYLSPLNFLFFYTGSLLIVLLSVPVFIGRTAAAASVKIPLAGLQALLFAVILLAGQASSGFRLTDDQWIVQFLSGRVL